MEGGFAAFVPSHFLLLAITRCGRTLAFSFDPFAQLVGTCTVQTFPLATPHIIQLSHPEKGVFWFVVMVHFHHITSCCHVFLITLSLDWGPCFVLQYFLPRLPTFSWFLKGGPCISFDLHSFDVTCAQLTMDWLYCRVPLPSHPPKPMRLKLTLQNHQSRLLEAQLRLEMCPCGGR